jgi:hypothetical protein
VVVVVAAVVVMEVVVMMEVVVVVAMVVVVLWLPSSCKFTQVIPTQSHDETQTPWLLILKSEKFMEE